MELVTTTKRRIWKSMAMWFVLGVAATIMATVLLFAFGVLSFNSFFKTTVPDSGFITLCQGDADISVPKGVTIKGYALEVDKDTDAVQVIQTPYVTTHKMTIRTMKDNPKYICIIYYASEVPQIDSREDLIKQLLSQVK